MLQALVGLSKPRLRVGWCIKGLYFFQKAELRPHLGGDLGSSVRQTLKAAFAPELARNLSLRGHNAKLQLADTTILDVMTGMLVLEPKH